MGARLIELPTHSDHRGNLTVLEGEHLPFEPKRIFYIWAAPWSAKRAGHANRTCRQILIATSGGFTVTVDGEMYHLYSRRYALVIEPMSWLELGPFTTGAVCLVVASTLYDPDDHIHDREEFLREGNGDAVDRRGVRIVREVTKYSIAFHGGYPSISRHWFPGARVGQRLMVSVNYTDSVIGKIVGVKLERSNR